MGQPSWAEPLSPWGKYTPRPGDPPLDPKGPTLGQGRQGAKPMPGTQPKAPVEANAWAPELSAPGPAPFSEEQRRSNREGLAGFLDKYLPPELADGVLSAFAGDKADEARTDATLSRGISALDKAKIKGHGASAMTVPEPTIDEWRERWTKANPEERQQIEQRLGIQPEELASHTPVPERARADVAAAPGGRQVDHGDDGDGLADGDTPPKKPRDQFATEDDNLKEMKGLIEKYENRNRKIDLSPLLALTDSWTGSKLAQSYQKPLSQEEHERTVLNLKEKLYQYEGNLNYKRAMMQQLSEQEKARLLSKAEDRESRERIKQAGRSATASGNATREQVKASKAEGAALSRYGRENKAAIASIAQKRYGKRKEDGTVDPMDRGWQVHTGPLNAEIHDFGKHLEATGQSQPGRGYYDALEFFNAHAGGPDSAGAAVGGGGG